LVERYKPKNRLAGKGKAKQPIPGQDPRSTFKPEYIKRARELMAAGATTRELADELDTRQPTLYRWARQHPEFAQAMSEGKELADRRVELSLYQKAVGYTRKVKKAVPGPDGELIFYDVEEEVEPDNTAMIFWLKNRLPLQWRDRKELTGRDGEPIRVLQINPTDLQQLGFDQKELAVLEKVLERLHGSRTGDTKLLEGRPVKGDPSAYEATLR